MHDKYQLERHFMDFMVRNSKRYKSIDQLYRDGISAVARNFAVQERSIEDMLMRSFDRKDFELWFKGL